MRRIAVEWALPLNRRVRLRRTDIDGEGASLHAFGLDGRPSWEVLSKARVGNVVPMAHPGDPHGTGIVLDDPDIDGLIERRRLAHLRTEGEGRRSPIVFIRKRKPLAASMDLHSVDWETLSLSLNPDFVDLIEESRRRHRREGGISSQEMRRRLTVK